MNTLKTHYEKSIRPSLGESLKITNVHAIPKMTKVIVNVGIGSYVVNQNKDFSPILENITRITGQRPIVIKAKKSVSNFKLREGMPTGLKVTLRGNRMYDFINKLVNTVLPRVRDFRGLPLRGFDGKGNYSLGLKEHTVFPEVRLDEDMRPFGLEITVVTTAGNDHNGRTFLKLIGFPFQVEKVNQKSK